MTDLIYKEPRTLSDLHFGGGEKEGQQGLCAGSLSLSWIYLGPWYHLVPYEHLFCEGTSFRRHPFRHAAHTAEPRGFRLEKRFCGFRGGGCVHRHAKGMGIQSSDDIFHPGTWKRTKLMFRGLWLAIWGG